MNPKDILIKYYDADSRAFVILLKHSQAVADLALQIARHSQIENLDLQFIHDASVLHDIGVFLCDAPEIDCHGTENYIRHGILGRAILEKEGLAKHALVCERHIGVGLTIDDIQKQNLPLPLRDMQPLSHEEIIITIADLFSSKLHPESFKSIHKVEKNIARYGPEKTMVFQKWKSIYKLKTFTITKNFEELS